MFTRKGLFGQTVTQCGIAALRVAYPGQMQGFLECDRTLILREGVITGAPNGSFSIDVSAMEAASQQIRDSVEKLIEKLKQEEDAAWEEYHAANSVEQASAALATANTAAHEAMHLRGYLSE